MNFEPSDPLSPVKGSVQGFKNGLIGHLNLNLDHSEPWAVSSL
jgi:hypothetical protein